jgi:hypothetical protein
MKTTFDEIQAPLKELLEMFEWTEYVNTSMNHINGGFTTTDYEDHNDEWVYFNLKWGIVDGVENTVHTESYKIAVSELLKDIPVIKKLKHIQDADGNCADDDDDDWRLIDNPPVV